MKKVVITRATSGSGKSHFANFIKELYSDTTICCADDFFYVEGEYRFNVNLLGRAHQACRDKFKKAVDESKEVIVVANTNTKSADFGFYSTYAKESGYEVIFIVLENRHNGQNLHGVPLATLEGQEKNIKSNLKLR